MADLRANDASDHGFASLLRQLSVYFGVSAPSGSLSLSYVTEGAANVIWRVHFSSDSNLRLHDGELVLRMRKDIASTVPMNIAEQHFERRIVPLFSSNPTLLLPVQLTELSQVVIEALNTKLLRLETTGKRHELRRGIYLPSFDVEPYAMVMPNLFHGDGAIVEFKPKWLAQSPSAPRDAERCRTCALNAFRRAAGHATGRGDSGFCPFDLLSRDEKILSAALAQIWRDENTSEQFRAVFKERVHPSLRHLQKLQQQHGAVGLQDFQSSNEDLPVAMAIRDCSVLLKVIRHQDRLEIISVKLLDLDLKDVGGGKLEKWARMESDLIDGSWYDARQTPGLQCAMSFQ